MSKEMCVSKRKANSGKLCKEGSRVRCRWGHFLKKHNLHKKIPEQQALSAADLLGGNYKLKSKYL